MPEQSQYNGRLRGLAGVISIVQQRLARWLDTGAVRLADGSQLAVANDPGCQQRSHFAGFARYGFARSQHRFIWGVHGRPRTRPLRRRRPLNHIKPLALAERAHQ